MARRAYGGCDVTNEYRLRHRAEDDVLVALQVEAGTVTGAACVLRGMPLDAWSYEDDPGLAGIALGADFEDIEEATLWPDDDGADGGTP